MSPAIISYNLKLFYILFYKPILLDIFDQITLIQLHICTQDKYYA
jgi:hypothetical protein